MDIPSRFIADYLGRQLGLDAEARDVLRFGAQNLFLGIVGLAAVSLVAWFLRCLPETLMLTGVVMVTRSFAGGAHLGRPLRCTVFTATIFPALGAAALAIANVGTIVPGFCAGATFVSLITVLMLAPVDNPAKPIRTGTHRRRLRKWAASAVVVAAVFQAYLLAGGLPACSLAAATGMGLLWQSFILTGVGRGVMQFIDRVLDFQPG